VYTGKKNFLPELEYFAGREVLLKKDPLWKECLLFLTQKLEREIKGVALSGSDCPEKRALLNGINEILEGKDYEPKEIV
jgi:hypothetical protein